MSRLKLRIRVFLFLVVLVQSTVARLINATIYDTDLQHITYEPRDKFCTRWENSWIFWRTCALWVQPWRSDRYRSGGRLFSVHRSLDHQRPSVTIEFEGSAIWLYGPPRSQISTIPPDYKICLYENHRLASNVICYRVDVAEAYSAARDYDEPVVIFAKGDLQYSKHRVVVSIGDPIDATRTYQGIQFSHALYTIDRPTPWPVDEDRWRFREVVMHNTHPLISYYPKLPVSTCSGWWFWEACHISGWTARTYRAEDGNVVSWHELKSSNEWGRSSWGIETSFTAGSVAVYGIPKTHVANIVDIQQAYLNSDHHDESVLLWRSDVLDPSSRTHLSIQLVKTASEEVSVFPFKSINYFEPQEYSSPNPPVGHIEYVAVPHDDRAVAYHPGRRCVRHFAWWCTRWYDPWSWREAGPSGNTLTYRSTVSSLRTSDDPVITLDFQGSAVYVYAAPKSFINSKHASQQICINGVCHIVDVEQAYLNAPRRVVLQSEESTKLGIRGSGTYRQDLLETDGNITVFSDMHPELEPVLIWSMTGLDDQVQHNLRLALATLPCPGDAEMSIAKVVYTKVSYQPGQTRPDTPIPQPDPRYEGPVYPPHASKWAPLEPPPALPTTYPTPTSLPDTPFPTANPPHGPPPRTTPPRSGHGTITHTWLIVCIVCTIPILVGLLIVIVEMGNSERTPLIPSVQNQPPPPPYYAPQSRLSNERYSVPRVPSTKPAPTPKPNLVPPTHQYRSTAGSGSSVASRNNPQPSPPSLTRYTVNQLNGGSNSADEHRNTRPASGPPGVQHSTTVSHPGVATQNNIRTAPDLAIPLHRSTVTTVLAPTIPPPPQANRTRQMPTPSIISSPPSYTQPPSYARHVVNRQLDSQTIVSNTSTVLPPYSQILAESHVRQQRAAEFVAEQSALRSQHQYAIPSPRGEVLQTGRRNNYGAVNSTQHRAIVVPAATGPPISAYAQPAIDNQNTASVHSQPLPNVIPPLARRASAVRHNAVSQPQDEPVGLVSHPAPNRTTSTANMVNLEQRAAALSGRVETPQMGEPNPRVNYATPALAHWAASQGYRIDGLAAAAADVSRTPRLGNGGRARRQLANGHVGSRNEPPVLSQRGPHENNWRVNAGTANPPAANSAGYNRNAERGRRGVNRGRGNSGGQGESARVPNPDPGQNSQPADSGSNRGGRGRRGRGRRQAGRNSGQQGGN